MNRLADTALIGGERSDATDHCLAGITRLSGEAKDAAGYLPAYDQRTYAEVNGHYLAISKISVQMTCSGDQSSPREA